LCERHRRLGACPDCISVCRYRLNVSAPNTSCGSVAIEAATAARRWDGRLRPSNGLSALIPSSAQGWLNGDRSPGHTRLGGGVAHVHQGDHRGHHWRWSGRPIKRRDQGGRPMRSGAFQDAASAPETSAGCRLISAVSRAAAGSPTPRLTPERTGPDQRRDRVATGHRRPVPMSGPGPSRLCPCPVGALGERATAGPPDDGAGTGRRLRRTPM
jgi:hypothetical protein